MADDYKKCPTCGNKSLEIVGLGVYECKKCGRVVLFGEVPFGGETKTKKGFIKKIKGWGGWRKIGGGLESAPKRKCQWPACKNEAREKFKGYWFCDSHLTRLSDNPEEFEKVSKYFKPSGGSLTLPIILLFSSLIVITSFLLFGPLSLLIAIPLTVIVGLVSYFFITRKYNRHPWIPGAILIALFLFSGYFIYTIFGSLSTKLPGIPGISSFSNQLCMAKCITTRFLDVSQWMNAGGLGEYCRKVACRQAEPVESLGCNECYTLEYSILRQTLIPIADTGSIKFTIKLAKEDYCINIAGARICGETPPAKNVSLKISSQDLKGISTKIGGKCSFNDNTITCNELGIKDLPLDFVIWFTPSCKDVLKWRYEFTYNYTGSGYSSIIIKDPSYNGKITTVPPKTTTGPLNIGIVGYDKVLTTGIDDITPLTISFVNTGRGTAFIKDINLTVFGPDNSLSVNDITDCRPFKFTNKDNYLSLDQSSLKFNRDIRPGENFFIDCMLDISNVKLGKGEYKTYTFVINATYEYRYSEEGNPIFIDNINYECNKITRYNWNVKICNTTDSECINNANKCMSGNECIGFEKIDFPLDAKDYEECKSGCYLYFYKDNIIANIPVDLNIGDEDNGALASINAICKSTSRIYPIPQCECLEYSYAGECISYKYDWCYTIDSSNDLIKVNCNVTGINKDTIIHVNSK